MPKVSETPVSTRLEPWLEEELRSLFEEENLSTSEGLRRALEEWYALRICPEIEFRRTPGGREAALEAGPLVWEVISTYLDCDSDLERLAEHYGWLEKASLESAITFYEHFPHRVDPLIAENERMARYLERELS